MPLKVRQLKAILSRSGFVWRPGKGSHTVWFHPVYTELEVTVSGHDGADAKPYQVKQVQKVLRRLEGK